MVLPAKAEKSTTTSARSAVPRSREWLNNVAEVEGLRVQVKGNVLVRNIDRRGQEAALGADLPEVRTRESRVGHAAGIVRRNGDFRGGHHADFGRSGVEHCRCRGSGSRNITRGGGYIDDRRQGIVAANRPNGKCHLAKGRAGGRKVSSGIKGEARDRSYRLRRW